MTHDLFNLFAWFEVMSVVAFALTGYKLEGSAIGGALNFTVTKSFAGSRQTRPSVGSCWLAPTYHARELISDRCFSH